MDIGRRNLRSLQRKKEKKKIKLFVFLFLTFVAAFFTSYFLIKNNMLVRDIVFVGNHHLKTDELRSLIKIKKGDELFGISGRELYDRLRTSPWIRDAIIKKELSGRVLINVIEAVPVAVLSMAGRAYLIDKEGNILEPMKEGTVLFLPVIKDIDYKNNREAYLEAVRFVNVLHNKRVMPYGDVIEITGQRPEDITLKFDKISIKIGMGDFEKKLERLEFVRDEIEKRKISVEYIDLRFANKIIVKPTGDMEREQISN
ncbi:cell division protein FtsQ [Dissulfurispira thermophila]|uniref:Cell division protein FtsQ n=2 Tax=root TaxID=1 RepID=A0A7G1GZE6_9BACT|nr:FtsQ-type POTRA domain-containing protein [Dissulfurispira thermophila]BCB95865.1 cell division protein FtsQ [Dissulfurispira thermophila]